MYIQSMAFRTLFVSTRTGQILLHYKIKWYFLRVHAHVELSNICIIDTITIYIK